MKWILKKKLLLALAVLLPCYSYSDSITPYYDQTGNAAATSNTWQMNNVFPSGVPGLDVQNVIYNYTIRKQTEDAVDVHLQNENALGSGYIFRETDSWLPGSMDGTEINKVVPIIPNIPREAWGDGSIQVDGLGSVDDPNVIYTYKVDPCYDPQSNPACPGFIPPKIEVPNIEIYDATTDAQISKFDNETYNEDETESEEDKEEREEEEEKDSKERLEKALAAADNSVMFATALAQAQMLDSMNRAINMNSYYGATIAGGVYKETVKLADKQLPENKNGLRNGLAQQLLHEKMVEMQYEK